MSRSSALFTSILSVFDMHDRNGALILKISFLFVISASSSPSTVIVPFITIYASL